MIAVRGKRLVVAALVTFLAVAGVVGIAIATQLANSGSAEAKSDACRATCEEQYGQCYRDTADRPACTNTYKQCLAACVNN